MAVSTVDKNIKLAETTILHNKLLFAQKVLHQVSPINSNEIIIDGD